MGVFENKSALRQSLLAKRLGLSFEDVFEKSLKIQKSFLASDAYGKTEKIALYSGCNNEVLTDEIFLHAVAHGKEVFYPKVSKAKNVLEFFRVKNKEALTAGSYGILEPRGGDGLKEAVSSFDIIIVPGIAFDLSGNRIGYGKGYYDMTLPACRRSCITIGFAYDMQVKQNIPCEPHDVKIDIIFTESQVFRFR